jgi:hypothetical protein
MLHDPDQHPTSRSRVRSDQPDVFLSPSSSPSDRARRSLRPTSAEVEKLCANRRSAPAAWCRGRAARHQRIWAALYRLRALLATSARLRDLAGVEQVIEQDGGAADARQDPPPPTPPALFPRCH